MKRTLIFLALIISACSRYDGPVTDVTSRESENCYVLQGRMGEQTRTGFKELEDGGYQMLWSKGDAVGIFSYDLKETGNINVRATLMDSSAGSASGIFIPETLIIPNWGGDIEGSVAMPRQDDEVFLVYYPYDEKTDIGLDDHCIHSTLENGQLQDRLNDRQVGQNGFSYDYATVHPGEKKIDFTLKSAMAYLRICVNSTEFTGYRLHSAYVRDVAGSIPMSGDFVFDTDKREIRPVEGKTFYGAKVSVTETDFSAQAAPEELYLTVFPGDYSAADLYADLCFISQNGNIATVLVKMDNPGILSTGVIKTIAFDNVGRDLCPDWYEPVDRRDFLNEVCYGAQNTFLVESGKSVTFDVKARGDVLKAKAPKYYGIMLESNLKNVKLLQMPDGVYSYEPKPTRLIPEDYRITVNCLSGNTASFGVVAIYDEDYNVLWSFMIWKYESGDSVGSVNYDGMDDCAFMDRALGARKGIAAALKAGSAGEGAAYFTWGRKDPFPWKNQVPSHYITEVGAGHDLQYAIEHPNVNMQDIPSGPGYWYGNGTDNMQRKDLWGAENKTTGENRNLRGHKTIYDPCPEGYRVPDYDALCRISERKHLAEIKFTTSDKRYAVQNDASVKHLEMTCPFTDMSAFAIKKVDGTYDYWLYHGNLWADSGWNNATADANKSGYCYWSNANQTSSKWRASIIRGWYNGAGTKWAFDFSDKMAGAYPVRCQKEN